MNQAEYRRKVEGYADSMQPMLSYMQGLDGPEKSACDMAIRISLNGMMEDLRMGREARSVSVDDARIYGLAEESGKALREEMGEKFNRYMDTLRGILVESNERMDPSLMEDVMSELIRRQGTDPRQYREGNRNPDNDPTTARNMRRSDRRKK